MECIFIKKCNCYEYRFLSLEELKKLFNYLEVWKFTKKICRKDLSVYYNPEKCGFYGFLRVVGEKHYYRIYLNKENFKKVGEIVKKGYNEKI